MLLSCFLLSSRNKHLILGSVYPVNTLYHHDIPFFFFYTKNGKDTYSSWKRNLRGFRFKIGWSLSSVLHPNDHILYRCTFFRRWLCLSLTNMISWSVAWWFLTRIVYCHWCNIQVWYVHTKGEIRYYLRCILKVNGFYVFKTILNNHTADPFFTSRKRKSNKTTHIFFVLILIFILWWNTGFISKYSR